MKTDGKPIRILLVDDHKSFLDGLSMLINSNKAAMQVIGTADSKTAVFDAVAETKPDLIMLDVDLGDDNGIEILPELTEKTDAKIIILAVALRNLFF